MEKAVMDEIESMLRHGNSYRTIQRVLNVKPYQIAEIAKEKGLSKPIFNNQPTMPQHECSALTDAIYWLELAERARIGKQKHGEKAERLRETIRIIKQMLGAGGE